ncbi:hypothetical protein [Loktanella sp. SALINAS62]|uniref:hypothetical protein n=1 Tax=Loktanella sp. SALINAS62 TaxID=2706124 RepID=UPI001B8BE07F|nr:hypothetical protein [Loktanella sp. SALINAS62]
MKTTAPKELGILVVAAVFGLIAGGVALVMFGFGFVGSLFVAGLLAILVAIVLWFGWRDAKDRNLQPGVTASGEKIGLGGTAPETKRTVAPNVSGSYGAAGSGNAAASKSDTASGATAAAAGGSADGNGGQASAAVGGQGAQTADPHDTATAGDGTASSGSQVSSQADTATSDTDSVQPASDAAAPAAAGSIVKPSAPLAGQEELSTRKGEWKYEGDAKGTSEVEATPDADTGTAANPGADGTASVAAQPSADATAGADATPTMADKPKLLDAAREGGPDNLKEIKGVGPKLELMLHDMGIFHFDQIAAWTSRELAWVDSNLKGFKGRASRDEWVSQAKILATGGDTEFSTRVDKGGVY